MSRKLRRLCRHRADTADTHHAHAREAMPEADDAGASIKVFDF